MMHHENKANPNHTPDVSGVFGGHIPEPKHFHKGGMMKPPPPPMGKAHMGDMKKAHMGDMRKDKQHGHKGMKKNMVKNRRHKARNHAGDSMGKVRPSHGRMVGKGMMKRPLRMGMGQRLRMGGRRRLEGELFYLVKRANGQCKCTQTPHGRLVLGKFKLLADCEDQRHGC